MVDKEKQLAIYSLRLTARNFSLYKNASPVEAQITFSIKDAVVQFSIKATLPPGYRLADSFTELRNQPALPINQIELEHGVLTLQSGTKPASHFEADLLPVGPLKTVKWLLGKKLTLTGSIDFAAEGNRQFPFINLATPNLDPFAFGIFELDISVRLRSVIQSFPNHDPAYVFSSHVELVTEFKTAELDLPVVLPLHGDGQHLLS